MHTFGMSYNHIQQLDGITQIEINLQQGYPLCQSGECRRVLFSITLRTLRS